MKGLDWCQVASNIAFDDDIEHVSDAAFRTFVELIAISAFRLSDGRVTRRDAQKQCNTRRFACAVEELVVSGHLTIDGDDLIVRCYAKYNPTREVIENKRTRNREAVSDYRSMSKRQVIQQSKSKSDSKSKKHTGASVFDAFWEKYPRKQDRGHAEKAWDKAVKIASPDEILAGLDAQLSRLEKMERRYVPLGATWLNGKRWTDEVYEAMDEDESRGRRDRVNRAAESFAWAKRFADNPERRAEYIFEASDRCVSLGEMKGAALQAGIVLDDSEWQEVERRRGQA